MRATLTTLFVIAMVIASTQTFRHIYVKWIDPGTSVLYQFRELTDSEIARAKQLEELIVLYRAARQKVIEYEADPDNPIIKHNERRYTEPYKAKYRIEQEIRGREQDQNELFKLKFYWTTGLVSLLAGVVIMSRYNPWLGLSSIIVGASEMLCWTSPLFHMHMTQQFTAFLHYKLAFSLVTWVVLVGLWLLGSKRALVRPD